MICHSDSNITNISHPSPIMVILSVSQISFGRCVDMYILVQASMKHLSR